MLKINFIALVTFACAYAFSFGQSDGLPNRILVRFTPTALDSSYFDDPEFISSTLKRFLTDDAMNTVNASLGADVGELQANRVYPKAVWSLKSSISRTGRVVKLPEFWTVLEVILPEEIDPEEFVVELSGLYGIVNNAELALSVGELLCSNGDPYYSNDQANLHPTSNYLNAHINIEPAWAYETGNSDLRVGVYDTGIDWRHADFGDGTLEGSRVAGGFDYIHMQPINQDTIFSNMFHGTGVAGLIGAIRCNGIGVSGIAGGDYSIDPESGVRLYSMRVMYNATVASSFLSSIFDGALDTLHGGLGLDVMNFSMGFWTSSPEMQRAYRFAFENSVVVAAGRGNYSTNSTIKFFPACLPDQLILSAGASDTNGVIYQAGAIVGSSYCSPSLYGANMDLLAPGSQFNVFSLENSTVNGVTPFCATSSASAHASGSAALLLSNFNKVPNPFGDLTPDDVEHLLEKYATDISMPGTPYLLGFDEISGAGRLNIGDAMGMIQRPDFDIRHFYSEDSVVSITTSLAASNVTFVAPYGFANGPVASYNVDVYQVEVILPVSVPVGYSIIDEWPIESATNLLDFQAGMSEDVPSLDIVGVFNNAARLRGHIFFVKSFDVAGIQITLNNWYPFDTAFAADSAKAGFAIHIAAPTSTANEADEAFRSLSCWPVPASEKLNVTWTSAVNSNYKVRIVDGFGRVVHEELGAEVKGGVENIEINTGQMASGAYSLVIDNGRQIVSRRIPIIR